MKKIIILLTIILSFILISLSVFADEGDGFARYDDDQKSDGSDIEASGQIDLMENETDGILVICIDPGHGGSDSGSVLYNGGYEKDNNLKIALFLKDALEEYGGVYVVMTRTDDESVVLSDRARIAANNSADLLVSIHTDYSWGGQASGISVFYPNDHYSKAISEAGYAAAVNVKNELTALGLGVFQGIRTRNIEEDDDDILNEDGLRAYTYPATEEDEANGVTIYSSDLIPGYRYTLGDYYGVIRNSKILGVPAIIVEHGFGNNADDFNSFMSDDEKLKSLAEADARAIAATYGLEKFEIAQMDDGNWYCVRNGEVYEKTFIAQGTVDGITGSWYVLDGQIQLQYTGLVTIDEDLWAISEGQVDDSFNGVAKDENGILWLLSGGRADNSFTGLKTYQDDIWWFERGKVNYDHCSVEFGEGSWWYVEDSKVQFEYNGIGTNENGTWLITDGKVTFSETGVVDGKDGNWYYAVNGKVQTGYTGIKNNANGWWRIVNGKVDFGCNTVEQNENGWWYCLDGKVQFSYNGIGTNSNGTWLITNGKVTFAQNGVVDGKDGNWYYAMNGKVQTGYTGIKNNANGWWRIVNGKVDFGCNTVEQNENGWWYCRGGKVQFGYTGIAPNAYGWWRIVNGKVDFSCNTVEQNENGWWYCQGGKVMFDYTGIGQNSNGSWYIKDGKVDFSFTGVYDGFTILNGRVIG